MSKPIPPQIAPKPGFVKVVRALYSYTAQNEDELSFSEGDILFVQQENGSDPGWWKARCGTNSGIIPSNYVELKSDTVDNPIHDAARRGNLEFLHECLRNGVTSTGLDASGATPLHWAARAGHLDCVLPLIEAGIKHFGNPEKFVNIQNRLGETPLHLSAAKDHLDIINVLLQNGANVSLLNKDQQTALDLCHDPAVKSTLQNSLLQPNEKDVQQDQDYLEESEDD